MPYRRLVHPSARTRATLRLLRSIGPLPRRRRLPRQQQPDAARLEYYKAILPHIARAARFDRAGVLELLRQERSRQGRMDAASGWDRAAARARERMAQELVDRAARAAVDLLDLRELRSIAEKFGQRTSEFQRQQLGRQVQAAMSVPLSAVEHPVPEKLEGFAALNVDLIKTVPERYFDRIRLDVQEAFELGTRPEDLADDFAERYGMAEDDARRIARDQIGKLNGQLNQERQEGMGVSGYTWRGAMDARERDEHVAREGERFDWDDPPEDGHPGEPILCRCYAEPDFSDVLEGL